MGRPKASDDENATGPRFAPNTIVVWYVGLKEHRGRVYGNLPGQYGHPSKVLIKGVDGNRYVVKATQVHVAGGLTQQ